MKTFNTKTFNIPALKGISAKNIEEHLKLYQGYVKNANLIAEKSGALFANYEENAYIIGELMRRFSFEYNGIRNHEIYFSQLEGGSKPLPSGSAFGKALEAEGITVDILVTSFKALALTRGIGWAMLYFDRKDKRFLMSWVDEQHLGQLNDCAPVLALDMWEHSYVADYQPSGKKNYIEDFFANLNWEVVENHFKNIK